MALSIGADLKFRVQVDVLMGGASGNVRRHGQIP